MNSEKKTSNLDENLFTLMIIPAKLFSESEMFQTKHVEEIGTHILYSINLLRNSCRL